MLELSDANIHDHLQGLILGAVVLTNSFGPNVDDKHIGSDQCISGHHFFVVLSAVMGTCSSARSIESFPSTSKTRIFYFLSTDTQIPLVVLVPAISWRTEKLVPNK